MTFDKLGMTFDKLGMTFDELGMTLGRGSVRREGERFAEAGAF
jgi:hypothetical protein